MIRPEPQSINILYVGSSNVTGTSFHRLSALRRLGHRVDQIDTSACLEAGTRFSREWRLRFQTGPMITRLNKTVENKASSGRFRIVWFDKALFIRPETVRAVRETGALTVHYNPDNPFGTRGDPGWRLFRKALLEYDVHLVPRPSNLADYRSAGVNHVLLFPFSYEPTVHFPPPDGWNDSDRLTDVGFIGTSMGNRAEFFRSLLYDHQIPVKLRGWRWDKHLLGVEREALLESGPIYGDDYRQQIWKTKINICFVSHENSDPWSRRSFEIAGCRQFMLAERTIGHLECFEEDKEIIFFSSVAECAEKIRYYLGREKERSKIAANAYQRAMRCGYSNDKRLQRVLEEIMSIDLKRRHELQGPAK